MRRHIAAAAAVLCLTAAFAVRRAASEGEAVRQFSIVNLEYKGTKVWVPGTLIVKQGETVKIKLVNNTPSGKHGFSIDAFAVKTEAANDGKPVNLEFKADKAGLYTIYCHLHPAHIGGQLLVLEK